MPNEEEVIEGEEGTGEELTPEQITELQDKAGKTDELETSLAEKETELEELRKLKGKDNNFQAFRNKTEEEKEKIMKKASETEQMLLKEMDDMRSTVEAGKEARMKEATDAVLQQIAGDDKEYKKEIELQEKEFIGYALTPKEKEERVLKAATLVKGQKPQVNKVFAHTPMADHTSPTKPNTRFTDTKEGQDILKDKFPEVAALEEKRK